MNVWAVIFANLVANKLKSIDEVPEHLKTEVTQLLGQGSESV